MFRSQQVSYSNMPSASSSVQHTGVSWNGDTTSTKCRREWSLYRCDGFITYAVSCVFKAATSFITLKNKFTNLGAQYVLSSFCGHVSFSHCLKPHSRCRPKGKQSYGDGITTAIVLACATYSEGVKNLAARCNPMDLCRGSQVATDRFLKFFCSHTKTITTTTEIAQVATISANGDVYVTNLITRAIEEVRKEGLIALKEGHAIEDEIEVTEGMCFDHGFISLHFVANAHSSRISPGGGVGHHIHFHWDNGQARRSCQRLPHPKLSIPFLPLPHLCTFLPL